MKVYILFLTLLFMGVVQAQELVIPNFCLEEAEQLALENNKDIRAMRQLLQKAKEGRLESLSKWWPEIVLISRGYGTQRKQPCTNSKSAFISQFSLWQALFSPEKYYDVKIAGLEVQQFKLLLDALVIDVLFDVRVAFYQIILDFETVATAEKNVEIFAVLAERMQSNYEIGTSILLNVNQSKVAIANATSTYYQAVKKLEIDLDRLVTLMGYNPGFVKLEFENREIPIGSIPEIACKVARVQEIFQKHGGQIYKPGFPLSEEKRMRHLFSEGEVKRWEAKALTYRPDLRSQYNKVKIADQVVCKQKGEYLPEVHLEANYGGYPTRMLDNASSSFFNQKFHYAVGFNVQWLLYDGCGRTYRINQARYERNAKKLEYAKGIQTTYEEVRKEIFAIEEATASLVTAEGNVRLAEQTLELASKQLEIGTITIFDYQVVVNGLIQSLNIRNGAQFDLISGYYGLRHASGVDLR